MTFPIFLLVGVVIVALTIAGALRLDDRLYRVAAAITGATVLMFTNAILWVRHYGDDSYITLRYSRNLADGVGPVWNPGERVEGYTNFLWMLILAGMHKAGMDLYDASLLLSYAAMMATLLLAWRIWELWARDEGGVVASPVMLAVVLLAIALNDGLAFWGFSGLETPLAAALLTGMALLYLRESRGHPLPWSAVVAVAAAMTRPELLFMAGVTGAFTSWDAYRTRDGVAVRRLVGWVLLFGVLYGTYFVWRYTYYGYVFPNTYYAKVGSSTDFIIRGLVYVRGNGMTYVFLPAAVGMVALIVTATERVRRDAIYLGALVSVWMAAVVVEGGDAFTHGRFVAPPAPIIYLAGICGLAVLLRRALPDGRQFAIVGGVAAGLAALAMAHASIDTILPRDRDAHEERRLLGLWMKRNVPDDYLIAAFAAGAVPYYSELPALDLFGLTDETIAHSDVPSFGQGVPAHEKYNIDYVLDVKRPHVIVLSDADAVLTPREVLENQPPSALPVFKLLFADERTWDLYEPAALHYQGRWFNMLVRKDVVASVPVDWTETGGFQRNARPLSGAGAAPGPGAAPTATP